MFTLSVRKSYSGSRRLFRHLITLLYTFQGWLVVRKQGWYQNLTDGDQEARLQHSIAIVLVKCLTGYETKGLQEWESGPVGGDEVHCTCREKPSCFFREGEKKSSLS